MAVQKESVSIARLDGGSTVPRLDLELQKLAENLLDPATSATATRELTLKIKIKPNEKRDLANISIGVTSKLAAPKPAETIVFVNQARDGTVTLSEREDRQEDLFEEEGESPAPSAPVSLQARKEARDAE